MRLQESGEMYLESILMIIKEKGSCRSIDICEKMGYSKPSVSRAVGILKEGGYILVDKDGHISLTDTGKDIAAKILERHTVLCKFLMSIGVDSELASQDACKMEHAMSDATFDAIKKHAGF